MHKQTKHFVIFYSPGSFFSEEESARIDSLDPYAVEWPANAFAFTLHEREDVVDGETVYAGKAHQIGGRYYHPDTKVETLDEVRANPKATRILISNMEGNGWERLAWCRTGNAQQLRDQDEVLERRPTTGSAP